MNGALVSQITLIAFVTWVAIFKHYSTYLKGAIGVHNIADSKTFDCLLLSEDIQSILFGNGGCSINAIMECLQRCTVAILSPGC